MAELPSTLKNIEMIILDMDGVLTSEEAYWDTAGLVVRDILESPAFLGLSPQEYTPVMDLYYNRLIRGNRTDWRKFLPRQMIVNCKSRGINSNWDLAYLTLGVYLVTLFSPSFYVFNEFLELDFQAEAIEDPAKAQSIQIKAKDSLEPVWDDLRSIATQGSWSQFLRLKDFHLWGNYFRRQKRLVAPLKNIAVQLMDDFHPDIKGLHLLDELNTLLQRHPSLRIPLFGRNTALWHDCRDLFQKWYLGEELYEKTYNRPVMYRPKPGLIHNEEPLLGRENTHQCLTQLKEAGYTLGIATGRPRMEIMTPLQKWDMLSYFEPNRIVTFDEVEEAEKQLHRQQIMKSIGKPHPFPFLRAIYPEGNVTNLFSHDPGSLPDPSKVLVVGDAQADIWAAKQIPCPSAAVLTGAIGPSARQHLEDAEPDLICENLLELTQALVTAKQT